MYSLQACLAVGLLGLSASPAMAISPRALRSLLEKRQDQLCYPQNMPIDQAVSSCPKKQQVDADGTCNSWIPNTATEAYDPADCSAYCEQYISKGYGQEVPLGNSFCQQNSVCTVAMGTSVTYTVGYSINIGISGGSGGTTEATFNAGASYSWSKATQYSTTTQLEKTLGANECGYWTFVPYTIKSCGVLSSSPVNGDSVNVFQQLALCAKDKATSQYDYCNTTPYVNGDGRADGATVLVKLDCASGTVLPMDQQDPAYQYPGVSTAPKKEEPGAIAGIAGMGAPDLLKDVSAWGNIGS